MKALKYAAMALLSVFGCRKDEEVTAEHLRIFTVKKGKHDFSPKEFRSVFKLDNIGALEYLVVFDKTCEYLIAGEDQGDFNKGGGLSFDFTSNTKNAAMWAWRHTPGVGIELAGYFHENGKTYIGMPGEMVAMVAQPGDRVKIHVWRAFDTWKITFVKLAPDDTALEYAEQEKMFSRLHTVGYRIGLWFGGNQPAPRDMQVWVDYKVMR